MAQQIQIVKEEIYDLFYNQGKSKKEIKELKFPNIPQNMWNQIWKDLGLHNKKAPSYTYEIIEGDKIPNKYGESSDLQDDDREHNEIKNTDST